MRDFCENKCNWGWRTADHVPLSTHASLINCGSRFTDSIEWFKRQRAPRVKGFLSVNSHSSLLHYPFNDARRRGVSREWSQVKCWRPTHSRKKENPVSARLCAKDGNGVCCAHSLEWMHTDVASTFGTSLQAVMSHLKHRVGTAC